MAAPSSPCCSAGIATANRSDRLPRRRASAKSVPLARQSSSRDCANEGPLLQGTRTGGLASQPLSLETPATLLEVGGPPASPGRSSAASVLVLVQRGRDRSARAGACSITRATAPGRLLAGTSRAIRKHLRDPAVGTGVAPEFIPKPNSELIGSRGRRPDDAVRLEIGEYRGPICRAGKDLLCRRRDTRLKRRRRQRSLEALAAPPLPQGDQHDRLLGCDSRDLVGGSDGQARMVGALRDCRGGPVILDCVRERLVTTSRW